MNPAALLPETFVCRLGWTLMHFIWQGAAIAALAMIALALLRRRSAPTRYIVSCVALFAMVATTLVTFVVIDAQTRPDAAQPALAHAPAARTTALSEPLLPSADAMNIAVATPSEAMPAVQIAPALPSTRGFRAWAQRCEPYFPHLVIGWTLGMLLLSVRLAGGWLQVRRIRTRLVEPPGSRLEAIADAIASDMRLSRHVRLLTSTAARVPMTIGWVRPVILLPIGVLTNLTIEQLEAILAHELAHVRRHDYLVNLLQSIVETLLFYHPCVWWISHRIRVEREHCCDDSAIAVCGDRLMYARTLAELERLRGTPATLAAAATGGSLVTRIRRIVGFPFPDHARSARWLAGVLAIALLAGTFAGVRLAASTSSTQQQPVLTATSNEWDTHTTSPIRLSGGGTVELIAVTHLNDASEPRTWWKPDGTPLPCEPYARTVPSNNIPGSFEFVLRMPRDVHCIAAREGQPLVEGRIPVDRAGKNVTELRKLEVPGLGKDRPETDLQVVVAGGVWQTSERWEERMPWAEGRPATHTISNRSDLVLVWPQAEPQGVGVFVDVTFKLSTDEQRRLVAFDRAGREFHADLQMLGRGVDLITQRYRFGGLNLKDLKRLELQKRPYETRILFHALSLAPGNRTAFTVEKNTEASSAEPTSEEPQARTARSSPDMVGTWFFENPEGDDEQMAIFADGRAVVLYSNGHKDETRLADRAIELREYDNLKTRLTLLPDATLLQRSDRAQGLAKIWTRIDAQPRTDLLRPLSGQAPAATQPAVDARQTELDRNLAQEKPSANPTTPTSESSGTSPRVYDVRDLLKDVKSSGNEATKQGQATDPEELRELIRTLVAPGTWGQDDSTDTRPGSIAIWNDRLVIRHTESVHQRLKSIFRQLRASTDKATPLGQRFQIAAAHPDLPELRGALANLEKEKSPAALDELLRLNASSVSGIEKLGHPTDSAGIRDVQRIRSAGREYVAVVARRFATDRRNADASGWGIAFFFNPDGELEASLGGQSSSDGFNGDDVQLITLNTPDRWFAWVHRFEPPASATRSPRRERSTDAPDRFPYSSDIHLVEPGFPMALRVRHYPNATAWTGEPKSGAEYRCPHFFWLHDENDKGQIKWGDQGIAADGQPHDMLLCWDASKGVFVGASRISFGGKPVFEVERDRSARFVATDREPRPASRPSDARAEPGPQPAAQAPGKVTKAIDVKGPPDELARNLTKILVSGTGALDIAEVKASSFTHQVILAGSPHAVRLAEEWLTKLDEKYANDADARSDPRSSTDARRSPATQPAPTPPIGAMVGTWFSDNPHGDEEQMAVFPDGRIVVLYSNGHRDETRLIDGRVELAEYNHSRPYMRLEDGKIYQDLSDPNGAGKVWTRIDPEPKTELLRPLTGPSASRPAEALSESPEFAIAIESRILAFSRSTGQRIWNELAHRTGRKDAVQALTDRDIEWLLHESQLDVHASHVTAPRLIANNGKAGSIQIGTERPLNLPIRGQTGSTALANVFTGRLLRFTASISPDRNSIALTGRASITSLTGSEPPNELAFSADFQQTIPNGGTVVTLCASSLNHLSLANDAVQRDAIAPGDRVQREVIIPSKVPTLRKAIPDATPDQVVLVLAKATVVLLDKGEPPAFPNLIASSSDPKAVYYIMGRVERPGVYSIAGKDAISIRQAIAAAGGLNRRLLGGKPWCRISRRNAQGNEYQIEIPDLDAILKGKEPDRAVDANDILYIDDTSHKPGERREPAEEKARAERRASPMPTTQPANNRGVFYLMGNVRRPGAYQLGGLMTLRRAITAAGGLEPNAKDAKAEITRKTESKEEPLPIVNLHAILQGDEPDVDIFPNDVINIR